MSSTLPDLIIPINSLVHIILSGSRRFFEITLCHKFSVEFFLMLVYKEALVCLNLSIKLLVAMSLFKTPEIIRILVIILDSTKMEHWSEIC